jgi:hypothetical protein
MMGCGILAIWHDIVPEHEAEVLGWYDKEHHFERLAVPGFRNVRRYHAEPGTAPRLFIRYETDDPGVLASPAYLDRLNHPTPWTLRCQPQFLNNSRTVCERIETHGGAEGGCAVTVRLSRPLGEEERQAIVRIAEARGVLGWERWTADLQRSTIPTREKQLRGGEDRYVDTVVVLHMRGPEEAAGCLDRLTPIVVDASQGSALIGAYRLAFAADDFAIVR